VAQPKAKMTTNAEMTASPSTLAKKEFRLILYTPPFFEIQSPSPTLPVIIQVFVEKIKSKNGKNIKKQWLFRALTRL
jgi:hypothetical protein